MAERVPFQTKELLERAHAIQEETALLIQDHELLVKAAEEAGIERAAMLQALGSGPSLSSNSAT